MNAQDMLDYALAQLDDPAVELAEREAAADPALAERLERLSRAIHRMLDDGRDPIVPPDGLAWRTLAVVAERRRRRPTLRDYIPVVVPFRWADVGVAACIFLAGLLTLIPAAYRGKLQRSQLGCVFNLQQLGLGLGQYANMHKVYPYAPPECPAAHAGSFAYMLNDAKLLPDRSVLDCPGEGRSNTPHQMPDFPTLLVILENSPHHYGRLVGWDYAYNLGNCRRTGKPGPLVAVFSAYVPILADRPGHDGNHHILEGNSPNHGGRGQNVLFTDGHVRWHHTRRLGPHDPDMFLNHHQLPGPGVHEADAALGAGTFRFDGRTSASGVPAAR